LDKEPKGSLNFRRLDSSLFKDMLGGVQESSLILKDHLLEAQKGPFQQIGNEEKAAGGQHGKARSS